jgi:hypothetical protein
MLVAIDGDGSGNGDFKISLTLKEVREKGQFLPCAVVGELGRAVERRLFSETNQRAWEDDQERINWIARQLFPGKLQESKRRAFKRALPAKAEEVMHAAGFFWALDLLARELIKAKRIDGERCEAIIGPYVRKGALTEAITNSPSALPAPAAGVDPGSPLARRRSAQRRPASPRLGSAP